MAERTVNRQATSLANAGNQRGAILMDRALNLAGALFLVSISVYILIPILVTLVMSFNDGNIIRFPIKSWSLRWYEDVASSPQYRSALWNSVIIASLTTLVSVLAGVSAAWVFFRYSFPMRGLLYLLLLFPLFMPGVVLGLGVAIVYGGFEVFGVPAYGSVYLVVAAHSLWAMPLVFMLMEATFKTVDTQIIEASYDLGGRPVQTFLQIVVPAVSTGLISSALFAFVISLNEFVMALFLTTRDTQTLPVLMWLSLRSAGTSRLAVAGVVLALVVVLSVGLMLFWHVRHMRRYGR
ncbi:MAG: ABC transporter permease subunit [Rhizobiales bacterium]|nr:ABC transporter permease subunit [Hyphomicrobiales bacterium]